MQPEEWDSLEPRTTTARGAPAPRPSARTRLPFKQDGQAALAGRTLPRGNTRALRRSCAGAGRMSAESSEHDLLQKPGHTLASLHGRRGGGSHTGTPRRAARVGAAAAAAGQTTARHTPGRAEGSHTSTPRRAAVATAPSGQGRGGPQRWMSPRVTRLGSAAHACSPVTTPWSALPCVAGSRGVGRGPWGLGAPAVCRQGSGEQGRGPRRAGGRERPAVKPRSWRTRLLSQQRRPASRECQTGRAHCGVTCETGLTQHTLAATRTWTRQEGGSTAGSAARKARLTRRLTARTARVSRSARDGTSPTVHWSLGAGLQHRPQGGAGPHLRLVCSSPLPCQDQ